MVDGHKAQYSHHEVEALDPASLSDEMAYVQERRVAYPVQDVHRALEVHPLASVRLEDLEVRYRMAVLHPSAVDPGQVACAPFDVVNIHEVVLGLLYWNAVALLAYLDARWDLVDGAGDLEVLTCVVLPYAVAFDVH